ncbi:MAG: 23S rRNA (adenine(2030)-N(6))-methyltransferase RlmJ [Nevskiales bacterium]|nr:23S rRNA (adenine(2030)-N(6))-methyltransferase RlmJ [Nevskiales bacterium]
MHYQHRYHAGNFADVFKHVLLVALFDALNRKPAPWCYVDTHAGAGRYDLRDAASRRTEEADSGIVRLWADPAPDPALAAYLQIVRAANSGEALRTYPGSPAIAAAMARPGDRLVLCERVPEVAAALRRALGADRRVAIHARDGYEAVSLLPPREKRGLILVDPPFERPDEFDATATFAAAALQRFSSGVLAIWFPYKNRHLTERWLRRMQRQTRQEAACCVLETGAHGEGQMRACGLLVVNPPFAFVQAMDAVLPVLASALAQGARAEARCEIWPARRDGAPA